VTLDERQDSKPGKAQAGHDVQMDLSAVAQEMSWSRASSAACLGVKVVTFLKSAAKENAVALTSAFCSSSGDQAGFRRSVIVPFRK
jgi:hypothetical protein